ncbi:hypothetical protein KXS07_35480 [Inquilinus limosus]|uniref:hypothetical protein n=1 Tax=Inquilinus limosus TaxID=171674 RepID=UPI003F157930
MTDFVVYTSDGDDDFEINQHIQAVIGVLGATADLRSLYRLYFDETPMGKGDVHAFHGPEGSRNVFVIDLYREPTDQLDIVSFAVRCDELLGPIVKSRLRSFFDSAAIQLGFEEANSSSRLSLMLDESRYPRLLGERGFTHRQVLCSYRFEDGPQAGSQKPG